MLKLILIEEGKKEELLKGDLQKITTYLQENEEIYSWMQDEDEEIELPALENVETIRELKFELEKIKLSWWSLEVAE